MKRFNDRESCREFIENLLKVTLDDVPLIHGISDEVVDLYLSDEMPKTTHKRSGFGILLKSYAIRNDDLKLLDAFKSGFLALASVNFLLQAPTASAIAGVFFSILEIGRNLLKKGIMLTPIQFQILTSLKSSSSRITVTELFNLLMQGKTEKIYGLTIQELAKELNKLSSIAAKNGSIISLVAKDSDNRWGIIDL